MLSHFPPVLRGAYGINLVFLFNVTIYQKWTYIKKLLKTTGYGNQKSS
jgi:hypothetical protein